MGLICLATLSNVPSYVIFYLLSWILPQQKFQWSQSPAVVLDPVVEAFRKEPQLLAGLNPEERERYLTLLGDEHLRIVYEPNFVDVDRVEDSSEESEMSD